MRPNGAETPRIREQEGRRLPRCQSVGWKRHLATGAQASQPSAGPGQPVSAARDRWPLWFRVLPLAMALAMALASMGSPSRWLSLAAWWAFQNRHAWRLSASRLTVWQRLIGWLLSGSTSRLPWRLAPPVGWAWVWPWGSRLGPAPQQDPWLKRLRPHRLDDGSSWRHTPGLATAAPGLSSTGRSSTFSGSGAL